MFKEYPLFRKIAYIVMTILGAVIFVMQAIFTAGGIHDPQWFIMAAAGYAALASVLGIQAATNITPAENQGGEDE